MADEETQDETAAGEPQEVLSPKERRRRKRSTHTGKPGKPRSGEQRHAERVAERARKAVARRRRRESEKAKRGDARGEGTPPRERAPGSQKIRQGVVTSAKGDKTITVRIEIARRHRTYEKIVRHSATLHAHDERNEAGEGDTVRVIECRPLSKTKHWRLTEIVEKAR